VVGSIVSVLGRLPRPHPRDRSEDGRRVYATDRLPAATAYADARATDSIGTLTRTVRHFEQPRIRSAERKTAGTSTVRNGPQTSAGRTGRPTSKRDRPQVKGWPPGDSASRPVNAEGDVETSREAPGQWLAVTFAHSV
jgi:hypothetical protein